MTWRIAMKRSVRKTLKKNPLGRAREKPEKAKASVRAKVEHPFHVLKNLFRHRKTRYRALANNTTQLFALFAFANLLLASRTFGRARARSPSWTAKRSRKHIKIRAATQSRGNTW